MLELVIELFAKGNILLLNDKKIIVIAKSYPKTKERTIRGGIEYTYPSKRYNLFSITDEELARLIAESDRETIVKTLAMDLGLGGGYSEEACHLAGIDKNKKKVDENAAKRLFEAILRMRTSTPGPCVYEDEFAPFELTKKQQPPISRPETLSVAIEEYYEKHLNSAKESKWALQLSAEKDKLLKIIERQKTHIDELGAEAEECQRKGELIYSSYSVVQEAITSLRQARQKHSWKEIKERLQGNQLVKGINEKEGMLELEL
jgi:predicted ribosome quality control (RQC) complex YloA/Tae2 family protein